MFHKSAFTKIGFLLTLLLIITSLLPVQNASARGRPIFLYVPYTVTSISYSDYSAAVHQFGDLLGDKIGRKIFTIVPPGDFKSSSDKVIRVINKGQADIVMLPIFAYLVAHKSSGAQVVASGLHGGTLTYYSQFMANHQTGFTKLRDLQGIDLCWVNSLSFSGYIIPSLMLKAERVKEGSGSWFAGTHNEVARMIYTGECKAGAAYVDVREALKADLPDIDEVVPVIAISPPIPYLYNFSIARNFPVDLRAGIGSALAEVSQSTGAAPFMASLGGDYFAQTDLSIFSGIEGLLKQARMTPKEAWNTYPQ